MNTSPEIEYCRLAPLKAAVKLESIGMRHSRGKSVTAQTRMDEILGEIWESRR